MSGSQSIISSQEVSPEYYSQKVRTEVEMGDTSDSQGL